VGDEILDFFKLKSEEQFKSRSVKPISLDIKTDEELTDVIELLKYI